MTYSRPWMFCGLATMALGVVLFCQQSFRPSQAGEPKPSDAKANDDGWKKLFDGRTLTGWKVAKLGGEGEVAVKDGAIVLDVGSEMTAIVYTGDVPKTNYEISLDGKRQGGSDFFCSTTFRVGDKPCTLVVGGWGGSLVGLSCIDDLDASENQTMSQMTFDENVWYHVRIRVTDAAIEAWIDDKQVANQPRKDHRFGIRPECDLCQPLGICTWDTKGAVKNIQMRRLPAGSQPESKPQELPAK
jgi:hypothetical protein